MSKQRIVVIGGVASGTAAAAQARRVGPDAEVVLFESGPNISYGACEMPYYLSGQIDSIDSLIINTPAQFQETRGVKVLANHTVMNINLSKSEILVRDNNDSREWTEKFDKCILATGASARKLDVEGEQSTNVVPFRELQDAANLKRIVTASDIQHAVVVGGGYVGVEVAEALILLGTRVTILDRQGLALRKYIPGELNSHIAAVLHRNGITVRKDAVQKFAAGRNGLVDSVWTTSGERIGCQLVVVAIGTKPNTDLAERSGLRIGATGAIKVDDGMRTSSPRVWACGDCIEVTRIVDQKKIPSTLATAAYRTARVAGANAARQGIGKRQTFDGVTPASAVKIFDLEVATAGLSLVEAHESGFDAISSVIQSWSRVKMYPGAQKIYIELIVERRSGRLLGAQMIGREGVVQRCNVLVGPIREGWSVSQVKELDLIYAPPFGPSLDPLIVAARQAEKKAKS